MKVSVIIPTYNEEKNLTACIAALKKQTVLPGEILVGDGGSTDKTVQIARDHGARVVLSKKRGAGHGRNIAAAAATGDVLAFTDADCQPTQQWVEEIAGSFTDGVVAVTGPGFPSSPRFSRRVVYFMTNKLMRLTVLLGKPAFSGYNCAYSSGAFRKLGGFREDMVTGEDINLSKRASRLGKVVYNPRAAVFHSTRREDRFGLGKMVYFHLKNGFRIMLLGRSAKTYPAVR